MFLCLRINKGVLLIFFFKILWEFPNYITMTTTSLSKNYKAIHQISQRLKFNEISEDEVGVLLRLLVASKPGAVVLELGTGTGMGLAWFIEGLDAQGQITTIEKDEKLIQIAQSYFQEEERIHFINEDANQ